MALKVQNLIESAIIISLRLTKVSGVWERAIMVYGYLRYDLSHT